MLECLHFSRTTRSLVLSIMLGVRRYSWGAVGMFLLVPVWSCANT